MTLLSNDFMQPDSTADVSDMATNDEMLHLSLAIHAVTSAPKQVLERTGVCHWCLDPLPDESLGNNLNPQVHGLFCNQDCRDDWEKEKRMNKIAGIN
jgi:hypothetical protein